MKIKLRYWQARSIINLLTKEISTGRGLTLRDRARAWRRGFLGATPSVFSASSKELRFYVSDFEENVLAKEINERHKEFADNKLLSHFLLSPYGCAENLVGAVFDGELALVERQGLPVGKPSRFFRELAGGFGWVLKPIRGCGGSGVIVVSLQSSGFMVNGTKRTETELDSMIATFDGYMVTELVRQGAYAEEIFADAANTIRILTMIDENGMPFAAATAHRIGTSISAPVDNCAKGGLSAFIDPNTGELGPARYTLPQFRGLSFDNHPDTGARISGVKVPGWDRVVELCLHLAKAFRFLPYVGWDVVVSDSRLVILEINDRPDLKLHQVHRGLLRDPRVRRFYRRHRVVGRH